MTEIGSEPTAASIWVTRFYPRILAGGTVLDVAAGSGRHARLLAGAGYRVLAIDRDADALRHCQGAQTLVSDLEAGPWPCASRQFEGIVVTNYLHRPLFPRLLASLAPSGVLIYETFAVGQEALGRPRRPEFLLNPGELLSYCAALHVLAYEDGYLDEPRRARVQRICAVRTGPALTGPQFGL